MIRPHSDSLDDPLDKELEALLAVTPAPGLELRIRNRVKAQAPSHDLRRGWIPVLGVPIVGVVAVMLWVVGSRPDAPSAPRVAVARPLPAALETSPHTAPAAAASSVTAAPVRAERRHRDNEPVPVANPSGVQGEVLVPIEDVRAWRELHALAQSGRLVLRETGTLVDETGNIPEIVVEPISIAPLASAAEGAEE